VTNLLFKPNVVVCKFSHLGIIDTDNFSVLRGAKSETRDEVHNPEDDGRHHEGISEPCAGISNLVTKLNPVPRLKPASRDHGKPVETGHAGLSEKGREDVSDSASHSM